MNRIFPAQIAQGFSFIKEESIKKFICKEKLSKKKQKELNNEKRIRWEFAPVSRVIPNKKKETEKNAKSWKKDQE